jgi:hypothetical protein
MTDLPPTPPAALDPIAPPDSGCVINGHPNPDMNGVVEFIVPTLYTSMMIERRMIELANLGAPEGLPRIRPDELSPLGFQRVEVIATLEYALKQAPTAFYMTDPQGNLRLTPAALPIYELERFDSSLFKVYLAYTRWVDSFRPAGASPPALSPGTPAQPPAG